MNSNLAILDVAVNVKNRPWVAMGDGVTDDTNAIKAAIAAVIAQGGGTVFLPAGKYLVSSPLSWNSNDVTLVGDGGAVVQASASFVGGAVIRIGQGSQSLLPCYRGGIRGLQVDMTRCSSPALVGVELVQTWFTHISRLRIFGVNGRLPVSQTAFQVNAGSIGASLPLVNWAANITVIDLQINGSFMYPIRHVSGVATDPTKAQVNRVTYFGGFAFGVNKTAVGAVGMQLETGDTTRVYGLALEDFETGCFVGTQNQGPLDFTMEDCTTPFKFGFTGLTVRVPVIKDQGA